MTAAIFEDIKKRMLHLLETELPASLTYHNVGHTKEVLEHSERIALSENIGDMRSILLLKTAALYHDIGFLHGYKNHEEKGCEIVKEELNGYFSEDEMKIIRGLIMATKIPQSPLTSLEQIICDADLDYLGRDDFEPISNGLKKEFLHYGIVKDDREWQEKQIAFFEHHHYFTNTSKNLRNNKKQEHLEKLKEIYTKAYGKKE